MLVNINNELEKYENVYNDAIKFVELSDKLKDLLNVEKNFTEYKNVMSELVQLINVERLLDAVNVESDLSNNKNIFTYNNKIINKKESNKLIKESIVGYELNKKYSLGSNVLTVLWQIKYFDNH